ncbi:glycosyltransferase [Polyangium aurulentum]|uniref:glycosyltransferase n=1 Tax=Polyangium aurulentum TaxID=2567896 RepID=UPI0010ADB777|nr:glycosyltransferase [Polyangium aurulentum]UQA63480.1 glycosyltransferase [Polyangium aurulentum]
MLASAPPLVSVLLPYRNAALTLAEALGSILEERAVTLELVAIDDGSTDEGPRIVAEAARGDARVVPIATGGVGIARALAAGHAASRGAFVARMDADDISLPGRLPRQVALLGEDERLGVVGVQVEPFPEEAVGEGLWRYVAWQNAIVTPEDHAREIFVEAPICHPSVMLRREALEAVGGFREVTWAEDYDLWLRLHTQGFRMAKVPEVLFRWRHHPGRATFRDERYAIVRFLEAKAHYLAPIVRASEGRALAVWGAGPTGKRLARMLADRGAPAALFVDIDPRKIGRTARGAPITAASALDPRRHFVVVAVGARGARDEIRPSLASLGFVEGRDFVCAS